MPVPRRIVPLGNNCGVDLSRFMSSSASSEVRQEQKPLAGAGDHTATRQKSVVPGCLTDGALLDALRSRVRRTVQPLGTNCGGD